jgi:hypothetical protein
LATDALRYQWEVSDYAEAFGIGGGGDAASFRHGLATLAERRGISDWEADADTWVSLGRGLRRANISEAAFMGYLESWAGSNELRRNLMRDGFEGTR